MTPEPEPDVKTLGHWVASGDEGAGGISSGRLHQGVDMAEGEDQTIVAITNAMGLPAEYVQPEFEMRSRQFGKTAQRLAELAKFASQWNPDLVEDRVLRGTISKREHARTQLRVSLPPKALKPKDTHGRGNKRNSQKAQKLARRKNRGR